jgi:hypothetical protein
MPEASNSNSHGYVHGWNVCTKYNAGGVEERLIYSTPSRVETRIPF